MTETEWKTCDNPKAMLGFLADERKPSERKLRLFSCACLRRVCNTLPDEQARKAVEVAERFADGLADEDEREQALMQAARARNLGGQAARWVLVSVARTGAMMIVDVAGQIAACPRGQEYDPSRWEAEWQAQCVLLRDLFGPLPFLPVAIAPSWRTTHVLEVAQSIYDNWAFDRMLELGQSLYQVGCNDREILRHCVWSEEHARGCWVVDLVLAKQ
jgi:hypothetical protein